MPRLSRINRRDRGFLAFSVGGDEQIRRSYLLALSLRTSQVAHGHLSICVPQGYSVPNRYAWAFDNVVEIPYPQSTVWSPLDEWNSIHASPYEQTIKVDNDMLFLRDISSWWDLLSPFGFSIAVGDSLPTGYAPAKFFSDNRLPLVNPAFQYFDRSRETFGLFHFLSGLGRCWQQISSACLIDPPPIPDVRTLWSVTLRLMDIGNRYGTGTVVPRVKEMQVSNLSVFEDLVDADSRTPIHYGSGKMIDAELFSGMESRFKGMLGRV